MSTMFKINATEISRQGWITRLHFHLCVLCFFFVFNISFCSYENKIFKVENRLILTNLKIPFSVNPS